MQEDIINKNYAEFVQLPPAVKPETHPFTDEEIKTLLNNDDNRICRIILCMIFTGFRPTEFFSIEIKNIDIENMLEAALKPKRAKTGSFLSIPGFNSIL